MMSRQNLAGEKYTFRLIPRASRENTPFTSIPDFPSIHPWRRMEHHAISFYICIRGVVLNLVLSKWSIKWSKSCWCDKIFNLPHLTIYNGWRYHATSGLPTWPLYFPTISWERFIISPHIQCTNLRLRQNYCLPILKPTCVTHWLYF